MAIYQAIIGRNEEVELVGIALHIPAKVDTGAFRSSIHATNIKVTEVDGKKTLTCKLLGHPCAPIARDFSTTEFDTVEIRSSNGHAEVRYETKLKIKLANKKFETSFSLANREKNLFPVLIGRKALRKRFIVDVGRGKVRVDKLAEKQGFDPDEYEEALE